MCGSRLGSNVRLNGLVRVYGAKFVKIGDETWVSQEAAFLATPSGWISIGACCDIGPGAFFVSGSHILGPSRRRAGNGLSAPILIGDGSWIGAHATILGGVTIGPGSLVAAGSVVIPGSYPPNTLLAGVPAVAKKQLPVA